MGTKWIGNGRKLDMIRTFMEHECYVYKFHALTCTVLPAKENFWSFQTAFHIQTHGATVTKLPDAIPLFALTCEPTTNHDVIMTCAQYTEVYGPRNKIYGGA